MKIMITLEKGPPTRVLSMGPVWDPEIYSCSYCGVRMRIYENDCKNMCLDKYIKIHGRS